MLVWLQVVSQQHLQLSELYTQQQSLQAARSDLARQLLAANRFQSQLRAEEASLKDVVQALKDANAVLELSEAEAKIQQVKLNRQVADLSSQLEAKQAEASRVGKRLTEVSASLSDEQSRSAKLTASLAAAQQQQLQDTRAALDLAREQAAESSKRCQVQSTTIEGLERRAVEQEQLLQEAAEQLKV